MKLLCVGVALLLIGSSAFAETITFNDGRTVTGKVLQTTANDIKVDLNGFTMTYYAEEIKDIDGKPLNSFISEAPKVPEVPEVIVSEPATKGPRTILDNSLEKKALILEFIEVFGTRSAMTANFNAMLEQASKEKPEEAKNIRDKFNIDEVIDRLIPLYDKQFTVQDLKSYIDFYSSNKGKKLISSIGEITKGSVEVVITYVKEKFPELDK